jgi:hypothetical protein
MMNPVNIPNAILEHSCLTSEQKWLYVCLQILCNRSVDGVYIGSIKELQRDAHFHSQRLIGVHLSVFRQYHIIEMGVEESGDRIPVNILSIRMKEPEEILDA